MPSHPTHSRTSIRVMITQRALRWAMVIATVFLCTGALAQDEDLLPLPLASSVMYEQYNEGNLYKTHFEAPYKEHLCQPRKIHLSPATDIDTSSGLYTATVSFTLDLSALAMDLAHHGDADASAIRTKVTFGRGAETEGNVVIDYETDDLFENRRHKITEAYSLVRFNYTSPTTGKYYQSDLIHHVFLKDLEAGKQRYWYNITVEVLVQQEEPQAAAAPQPFFPPLLLPAENLYLSQHPGTSFYLRGCYFPNNRRRRAESKSQQINPNPNRRVVLVVGETPSYEFTTPPLYGSPTSIALVGDLGQTKNSTRTMARILGAATQGSYETTHGKLHQDGGDAKKDDDDDDRLVTSLFIAGDLSYADGDPDRWESWLDLSEPLLRQVPFASVPGNHEIECDKMSHDVFVPYESFFRNPNRIAEAIEVPPSQDYIDALNGWCTTPSEFLGLYDYGNAYFSHKQGLVHTIFLNSYASLLDGSKQREWLTQTALPQVDRTLTPWLVVIFHTPLYTTFSNHYHELNPELIKASGVLDALERYKVNLVVSGHDHAYMRTKALDANGMVAPSGNATIFWTLGAGGNREGHAKYRSETPEDWVAQRNNDEFGFGLFFAPNETHAHLQWMRDEDNDVGSSSPGNSSLVMRDSVWIENYYHN